MDFSIEKIVANKQEKNDSYVIYFLLYDDEVVYVGQSKGVYTRIMSHMKSKKIFNAISFFEVDQLKIDEIEADMIVKFNPKYNLSIPRCDKYVRGADLMAIDKDILTAIKPVYTERHRANANVTYPVYLHSDVKNLLEKRDKDE